MSRSALEIISLFFISLFVFLWGLSSQEIITFDSRFYLFALEMWRNGPSWFPTTYHEPYPDYPASSTFLIYLIAKVVGGMNKLVAVLPSAIMAALTLTFTYLIGALNNKKWGMYAVCFLLLTFTFLKSARSISLDMYPAFVTAVCFYLVYRADVYKHYSLVKWVYLLFVIGFVFRGPIGLVIPTGVVCTYYLLNGNIKKCLQIGFTSLAVLIISTLLLLALAYHVGGLVFLHDVLRMEVVGRIDNSFLPPYFYFTAGMTNYALSLPLACLVMIGVFFSFIIKEALLHKKFLLQLFGWMLIIMIGMSLPGDKKIRYILPMVPAAALISAYLFVAQQNKYFKFLRTFFVFLFLCLPSIFLAALWFIAHHVKLDVALPYLSTSILLAILQLIAISLVFLKQHDLYIVLIATVTFVVIDISIIEPIELYVDKTRDFVTMVEQKRLQQHAQLVFFKERPDGTPIKYLIDMPEEDPVLFIDQEEKLLQFKTPAFFITSVSYFDSLSPSIKKQLHVIAQGKIGHVAVIVFEKGKNK